MIVLAIRSEQPAANGQQPRLKTKPRSEIQARAAAVEAVRNIEVQLDHRRDDEESAAGAAMPFGISQARTELGNLRHVHESGDAKLRAVKNGRQWHAQLAGGYHHSIADERAAAEPPQVG